MLYQVHGDVCAVQRVHIYNIIYIYIYIYIYLILGSEREIIFFNLETYPRVVIARKQNFEVCCCFLLYTRRSVYLLSA